MWNASMDSTKATKHYNPLVTKLEMCITNLTCDELIMKIMQSSFIHRFVHFTHEYHALKTCSTHGSMC